MKRSNLFKLKLSIVCLIPIFYACSGNDTKQTETKSETTSTSPEDAVKQGERLVAIMGCNDCHTPKKMGPKGPELDTDLLLSGYPSDRPVVKFDNKLIKEGFSTFYPDLTAAAGPWGVSFAGNLTPDETGIGNWTEAQFKRAITMGKYKGLEGSRDLMPPMPWMNYQMLNDDEIHAIFSYLKSIKPVKNIVPSLIAPSDM